jgi:hypothetical protein
MPPMEGYRFEHARVAQRDFSSWWQRMVIRKGSDYGIPVGAPVVFSGGVVGRIAEVHAYTSVVELISDPGLRIAAVVDGDTRPISFQGGDNPVFGAPKGVDRVRALDVYASAAAEAPRHLGARRSFPPGLTIGRIVHVEPSSDGLFKTGEVQLDPRLSELTEVTVLVARRPADRPPPTMRRAAVLFLTLYLLHAWSRRRTRPGLRARLALRRRPLRRLSRRWCCRSRQGFAAVLLAGCCATPTRRWVRDPRGCCSPRPTPWSSTCASACQRDETAVRVAVALLANLGLFLALSCFRIGRAAGTRRRPGRLLSPTWSPRSCSSR